MANVLIVRSARIGDALIAVPIIFDVAEKNIKDNFFVVTDPKFKGIYEKMPENVFFIPMAMKKRKGAFRGLSFVWERYLLIKRIKRKYSFDKIALLKYDTFDKKIEKIYKNKADIKHIESDYFNSKERIEKRVNDGLTLSSLYVEVFEKLGYTDITPRFDPAEFKSEDLTSVFLSLNIQHGVDKVLVIAPFSRVEMKIYPLNKIKEILRYYEENRSDVKVLIAGGGAYEKEQARLLEKEFSNVRSIVGQFSMDFELSLMAQSDALFTMDSSNMHLASLVGVPVVSIWGPNDPSLGFYPVNLPIENTIKKELSCRPCSLFGEYPCTRENKMECMEIDSRIVIEKLNEFI